MKKRPKRNPEIYCIGPRLFCAKDMVSIKVVNYLNNNGINRQDYAIAFGTGLIEIKNNEKEIQKLLIKFNKELQNDIYRV